MKEEKLARPPPLITGRGGKQKRGPRILLIGWQGHPAESFYNWFKFWGCEVWWIGDGARDLNISSVPAHPINGYDGPMGLVSIFERRIKMDTILDLFGDLNFDLIFHCQDWTKITGYEKSPIPYVFYHTEPFYPHGVPNAAWAVAVPSQTLLDQTKDWFGGRFRYMVVPHALRDDCRQIVANNLHRFAINRTRQIPVSFAGTVYSRGIYNFRIPIIDYFRDHVPGFYFYNSTATVKKKDDDTRNYIVDQEWYEKNKQKDNRLHRQAYMGVLSRSQFGLNIPSRFGPNYRDLENCAAGAVNLSLETDDHELYGYIDGENCVLYRTPEEAAEIVKGGYDPRIAMRGQMHTLNNHCYAKRVADLLPALSDMGYMPDTYQDPTRSPAIGAQSMEV